MIGNEPGLGFKIEHVWAFLSQGEGDADEGVCAFAGSDGMYYPMVAADEKRLEQLRPLAKGLAKATGRAVKLVRFDQRVDLEEFK